MVKQSAALCLLRLFRTDRNIIPGGEWTSRIIHLLNDQHMGVVTAAVSLIDALVKRNPDEYKGCVSLAVSRLSRIVTSSYTDFQVRGLTNQVKFRPHALGNQARIITEDLPHSQIQIGSFSIPQMRNDK